MSASTPHSLHTSFGTRCKGNPRDFSHWVQFWVTKPPSLLRTIWLRAWQHIEVLPKRARLIWIPVTRQLEIIGITSMPINCERKEVAYPISNISSSGSLSSSYLNLQHCLVNPICSGLMEQDTFMRDNIVNHKGVNYDAKTQLQAVPERV